MRIMGLDPGSRRTGFAIIETKPSIHVVSFGVIKLNESQSFDSRLAELGTELRQLLSRYQPDCCVVEKIFLGKNADSAFKLGHARGVVLYESRLQGAQLMEYATRQVKQGVTGSGAASKEEVALALQRSFKLQPIESADASDALALAVHHAYQCSFAERAAGVFV